MKDDVILQLFKDDSFFSQTEPKSDAVLMQRPIAGYNLEASDEPEDKVSEEAQPTKEKDENDSKKGNQNKKGTSAFLKNQAEFDKSRISFNQNQWAKAQLIRISRTSPESIPQIEAAIEQRISSVGKLTAPEQHRFLRQFPLEFVAPQLRFELAEQLIAEKYVAEAENILASLLGFLPTTAEQIQSAEISVDVASKDAFVELWSEIQDAQYGTSVTVDSESETSQASSSLKYDRVDVKTVVVPNKYQRDYPTVVQPRGELAKRLFKGKGLSVWATEMEFEVLSPTGEPETRFKMFKNGVNRNTNLRGGSGWIQSNHSLAILRHKDLVLALDLSKLDLGQPAVLWKRMVTPVAGLRQEISDELDLIVNPSLRSEDVTASFPTTGCCCFIEKDKLTCVDAFTGTTLWTRTTDANHKYVLADERPSCDDGCKAKRE